MLMLRLAIVSLIAFGLDRLSKFIVLHRLDLDSVHRLAVWPPYFDLVMAWNKGVNFGFLKGFDARWLLVALSVAVSAALFMWARNMPGWLAAIASGAVIGGALGNAYDRVVYGAVADYINMSCCSINNPYSFNVADVFIFGGAIILVIGHEAGKRRRE